jgi:hypothetical protein
LGHLLESRGVNTACDDPIARGRRIAAIIQWPLWMKGLRVLPAAIEATGFNLPREFGRFGRKLDQTRCASTRSIFSAPQSARPGSSF